MSGSIAVINAGSSSIKFAICTEADDPDILFRGQIQGLGVSPHLSVKDAEGATLVERAWPAARFDHAAATRVILDTGVRLTAGMPVKGIGHRIVHGGMKFEVLVQFILSVSTTAMLAYFITPPAPHSRQRAYFYL